MLFHRIFILSTLLFALTINGCTRVGPDMMHKDRFDYTTAVGDSWREQVLLNIVRIRYSDWPTFVAVDQIFTTYTMEHTGTAKFTGRRCWSDNVTNDQLEAGWVGKFAERPTILYKPLSGESYVNAMLTPAKPASVFALIESGWRADNLSRIALRSVNGNFNTKAEYGVMHRTPMEATLRANQRFTGMVGKEEIGLTGTPLYCCKIKRVCLIFA